MPPPSFEAAKRLGAHMAKVLIIASSWRKNSNSTGLAKQVAKGAKSIKHDVHFMDVSRLNIGPCRGCEGCHQPKSKGCVVKDDMQALYPRFNEADVVIFASPIYWFNLGGQIKQFIDRLYAVALPEIGDAPSPLRGKKLGAVLVYGGDDPFDSGCVNAIRSIQDICQYTSAAWAGALYASAMEPGACADNDALMRKALEYGKSL